MCARDSLCVVCAVGAILTLHPGGQDGVRRDDHNRRVRRERIQVLSAFTACLCTPRAEPAGTHVHCSGPLSGSRSPQCPLATGAVVGGVEGDPGACASD